MTKEELKALGLTDEQVEKVHEDYGKNYVPKGQFNAKVDELKGVKDELVTVKGEVDKLQKSHKDNKELNEQIEALKASSKAREEEFNKRIAQMEIDAIVEKSILTAKGRNAKAIKALLKLDDAKIEDGTIKGLDEQLKELQKSDSYLFGEVKPTSPKPGDYGDTTPKVITKEEFNKMTVSQRTELYLKDEQLYNSLKEQGE